MATMPIKNQRAATGIKQANDLGIQAISGGLAAQPNIKRASQQAGAALATQTGQQQVAQAAQQAQQAATIGQQQVAAVGDAAQNALATRKIGIDKQNLTNVQKLGMLNEDIKDKLFDANMTFQRDEQGRAFFNERQLADWAKIKARSVEEQKNYAQQAQQAYARKEQVLKAAHAKILQQIDQESKKSIQDYNHTVMKQMKNDAFALEEMLRDNNAAKMASASTWGFLGGVAGAVAGGILGAPTGGTFSPAMAAAGYAWGTAIGTEAGPSIDGTETGTASTQRTAR